MKSLSIIAVHKFLNILEHTNISLFANQDVQVLFLGTEFT